MKVLILMIALTQLVWPQERQTIHMLMSEEMAKYSNYDSLIIDLYDQIKVNVKITLVPTARHKEMAGHLDIDAIDLKTDSYINNEYEKIEIGGLVHEVKLFGLEETPELDSISIINERVMIRHGVIHASEVIEKFEFSPVYVPNIKSGIKMLLIQREKYMLMGVFIAKMLNQKISTKLYEKSETLGQFKIYHWVRKEHKEIIQKLKPLLLDLRKKIKLNFEPVDSLGEL